jgi:hypothetical protein
MVSCSSHVLRDGIAVQISAVDSLELELSSELSGLVIDKVYACTVGSPSWADVVSSSLAGCVARLTPSIHGKDSFG